MKGWSLYQIFNITKFKNILNFSVPRTRHRLKKEIGLVNPLPVVPTVPKSVRIIRLITKLVD